MNKQEIQRPIQAPIARISRRIQIACRVGCGLEYPACPEWSTRLNQALRRRDVAGEQGVISRHQRVDLQFRLAGR